MALPESTDPFASLSFTDPAVFRGESAGVYPRVSDPHQATPDKTSLADQEASCRAYAARYGLVVDEACVRPEAHTSLTLERPELQDLIRTMKARGVRHLLMDRVDRVSREGQAAAAAFVNGLDEAGIILHVAYPMPLAVVGQAAVKQFLDFAFYAWLDNVSRARNFQRGRRSRAASGQYVKGCKAPYGYEFIPGDPRRRLQPHPSQYPVLERMCRERLAGVPYRRIAESLTRDGIPTAKAEAGHRNAATVWRPNVIRQIVENPITMGKVTAFREAYGRIHPADDKHKRAWRTVTRRPESEVVVLPDDTVTRHPLTPQEYQTIRDMTGVRWPVRYPDIPKGAALVGGLAKHDCGGTLILSRKKARTGGWHRYYTCLRHKNEPTSCPNVVIRVADLDGMVWREVSERFLQPGQIEAWAEKQRQADLMRAPESNLAAWQRTLVEAQKEADKYRRAIARAETEDEEILFQHDMRAALERARQAEERVAALEADVADERRYRAFVADVTFHISRYHGVLRLLDPEGPLWVPSLAGMILRALGVKVRAWRQATDIVPAGMDRMRAEMRVEVELDVTPASLRPWFDETPEVPDDDDEMEEILSLTLLAGLREGEEQLNVAGKLEGYRLLAEWLVKEYGQEEAVMRLEEWKDDVLASLSRKLRSS